jgi:cell division protein FtsI (penicillin-binding protein 3)
MSAIWRRLMRHEHNAPLVRPSAVDWRVGFTRRIVVAVWILGVWCAVIETRLIFLQVVRHGDLMARASRQQMRTVQAPAKRGDILDRHGKVLATSVDADSIYAVPSEIDDPDRVATQLCGALADCAAKEKESLAERLGRTKAFAYVRRQVSPGEARAVAALNLDGIGFFKESRRFYPNKELAAHLLGYVGLDNGGLSGVESTYDSYIRGKSGTILIQTDARRHAFSRFERPPTSGASVELTIDEYLQHITERELRDGVAENRAAGGTAIVMNPRTGEILAMANVPTFNPNSYRDSQEVERRNRAVQDLYEPGSTFKMVTASAAIEEKVMPLDTLIDTNPGQIRIDRSRIVRDVRNHGVLSFGDVIVESSNVGAIKIGFKVGAQRMSDYVQRFGFGRQVSPDFPGESSGIVWSADKLSETALASVSMGYQVGVTPLQMAAAVSAVANGGEYIEPRIVRAVYRGNRRYNVQPKVVRRSISADTAAVLTAIMEDVVVRGTAKAAQIPGFTIAGKTGTAAKLVNGRYSRSEYNGSFIGFVPSRNPALAIIVVLDSPHGPHGYYGGAVSAPIFKKIAEPALQYLGIGPTLNPLPPVLLARRDAGSSMVQVPETPIQPVVSLVLDGSVDTIPDLRGLSARAALQALGRLGLAARVTGDGFVVSQQPPAGAPLDPGAVCRLVLERSPARHPATTTQP